MRHRDAEIQRVKTKLYRKNIFSVPLRLCVEIPTPGDYSQIQL